MDNYILLCHSQRMAKKMFKHRNPYHSHSMKCHIIGISSEVRKIQSLDSIISR